MKLSFPILVSFVLLGFSANLAATELINPPKEGQQYETLRVRFVENFQVENPFDLVTNQIELLIQQPDFSTRALLFFYDGLNADSVLSLSVPAFSKDLACLVMRLP